MKIPMILRPPPFLRTRIPHIAKTLEFVARGTGILFRTDDMVEDDVKIDFKTVGMGNEALYQARHAYAHGGKGVDILSLEMKEADLRARFAADELGVDLFAYSVCSL